MNYKRMNKLRITNYSVKDPPLINNGFTRIFYEYWIV